jgi:hypothetical protein
MQMRKSLVVLALVAVFVATSFAASVPTPIVLTNDDNPSGNTATAYHLDTTSGNFTLVKTLTTGGFGLGGGFFAATGTAIVSNGSCVFVADTGSDDIAAFSSATNFGHVTPNVGIPGMFSANGAGGSIALSPNGKLLVSGNSGTLNISLWSVGAGCVLSHVADYVPNAGADTFSPVAFTPNGVGVVVPVIDFEAVEGYLVQNSPPALLDKATLDFTTLADCQNLGCFPTGMDFTNDSSVIVFGNASGGQNSVLTANVSLTKGLFNPLNWTLDPVPGGTINPNVPYFSKNGAAGNGELYIGMSGFSTNGPSGEVTTMFKESPLSITVEGGTLIPTPDQFLGSIRTLGATGSGSGGGTLVYAAVPNVLGSAKIGAGGTLTLGPTVSVPNGASDLSISVFPSQR